MKTKQKLNFRFHNPNTPEVTQKALIDIFIQANLPKIERKMRVATNEDNENRVS
jgi:hypothetical protein